jgi:hypothetical protein
VTKFTSEATIESAERVGECLQETLRYRRPRVSNSQWSSSARFLAAGSGFAHTHPYH